MDGLMWTPIFEAPDEMKSAAIIVRFTCECAKGGVALLSASRIKGQWIIPPGVDHAFDITHFIQLPDPPLEAFHPPDFPHVAGHC